MIDTRLYTQEWLNDGQIILFTLLENSREAVDAFTDAIQQVWADWDEQHPFLAIYDVSLDDSALAPYTREQLSELVYHTPGYFHGAYAVVVNSDIVSSIMQLFMRIIREDQTGFEHAVFTNVERAVVWVEKKLPGDA